MHGMHSIIPLDGTIRKSNWPFLPQKKLYSQFFFFQIFSNLRNDLASVVYCSVIENGSDEEWNFLWNKFKSTNLDDERKITLNALGCVRRVDLMKVTKFSTRSPQNDIYNGMKFSSDSQKYLELILSNEIQLKNKHDALVSTLTKKQNLRLVLDFVISKHKAIDDA